MTGPAPVPIRPLASPLSDETAAALAALHARAYAGIGLRPWSASEIASLVALPTGRLWVAGGEDGDMRGFLLGSVLVDEGEILALAVDPAHRRQTTARRLVEAMVADIRLENVERLILEVASTNEAATALYEVLNFRDIAMRPDYYRIDGQKVDARLMEKRLF